MQEYLSARQVAKILGTNHQRVMRMVKRGELKAHATLQDGYLFDPSYIEMYKKTNGPKQAAEAVA